MKSIFEETYRRIKKQLVSESFGDSVDIAFSTKELKNVIIPEITINGKKYTDCVLTYRVFNDYRYPGEDFEGDIGAYDSDMARKSAPADCWHDNTHLSLDLDGRIQSAIGTNEAGMKEDFTEQLERDVYLSTTAGPNGENLADLLTAKAAELIENGEFENVRM